jgi:hypothetical protein
MKDVLHLPSVSPLRLLQLMHKSAVSTQLALAIMDLSPTEQLVPIETKRVPPTS